MRDESYMKYAKRRKELLDKIQENIKLAHVADGQGAPAYDHAMAEIQVAIGLLNDLGNQEMVEVHSELTRKTKELTLMESILLEPEQKQLLCEFVEADRRAPKSRRGKFFAISTFGTSYFMYDSVPGTKVIGSLTDTEILAEKGLLGRGYTPTGDPTFYVKPEGIHYYKELKQADQPPQAIEKEVRRYLSSDEFKNLYPIPFKKLTDAETLLWDSDSEDQFTTIGHLCREALQEFADALVQKYRPPNVDPDKAHTVARIKSILELRSQNLGSTENEFLKSLIAYWGCVSDLVQRQEHGSQRDKDSLLWGDARRVVFQTFTVMYEIYRSLTNN